MSLIKIIFILIVANTFFLGVFAQASSKATPKIVKIVNMKFIPADLSVKAGESITWLNEDIVPHTVTSIDGAFDSKIIEAGKSWTYQANKIGTFDYKCAYHPPMRASLSVK